VTGKKEKKENKSYESFFKLRKKTPPPGKEIPSKKEKESRKRVKPGKLKKEIDRGSE